MKDPPKKYFRLFPGGEVRLKHAYFITCNEVIKNDAGDVIELRCSYDPASRGGQSPDGRKVKGTLHWVSIPHAVDAEVRLYEHLFTKEDPDDLPDGGDFTDNINPHSLEVLPDCKVEPMLGEAEVGETFQFMRHGYFCVDPDSTDAKKVFNRTVSLRDSWAKMGKK